MSPFKFFIFFLLLPSHLLSQEKNSNSTVKIEVGSSYSYTRINGLIGASITKKNNEFGLGARTSITNFSKYSSAPFVGFYLDYNRTMSTEKKWTSLINIHYGNLFRKIYSPINTEKSIFQLHEIYFGYGLSYKFHNLYITNTINYGGYMERQMNFYKNEEVTFFHIGPMIKLFIKYEL